LGFSEELAELLPQDLPNRDVVILKAAEHLGLIVEANRQFNLTRITGERDAAIKHVVDSVLPWRLFEAARRVMDAGTGAGLPGVPLALVFPETRFILSESIGKKARFVESAVRALGLANIDVTTRRAEELLKTVRVDIVTARAVAPINRAAGLFAPALRKGTKALLYKGPDAPTEITEAQAELRKMKINSRVIQEYELPDNSGSRTIVELSYQSTTEPSSASY
jgi:16S rRNA (guanine527-N7)-methyltransferase